MDSLTTNTPAPTVSTEATSQYNRHSQTSQHDSRKRQKIKLQR